MCKNTHHKFLIYLFVLIAISLFLTSCDNNNGGNNKEPEKKVEAPKKDYFLYEKDNSLYYSALNGSEAVKISTNMPKPQDQNNEYNSASMLFEVNTFVSKNKNRLFTMEDPPNFEENGTLKFYDIGENSELSNETVISEKVWTYQVSDDGNIVTYLKGDTVNATSLNQYDVNTKETKTLADNSSYFYTSSDGKRVVYLTDGFYYELEVGKGPQEVSSIGGWFDFYNDKFDSYYFIDEDVLYKKEFGKEKVEISKNVANILKAYTDGKVYYTILDNESEPVKLDFVTDDMVQSDAKIQSVEPVPAPNIDDFPSFEEFDVANNKYLDNHELQEKFRLKTVRDEYRYKIANNEQLTAPKYSYAFYDGNKSTVIGSWVADYSNDRGFMSNNVVFNEKTPMLIFKISNKTPIKLSQIGYYYDLQALIERAITSNTDSYIAIGSDVTKFDFDNITNFTNTDASFSFDGNKAFIMPISKQTVIENDIAKNYGYDLYEVDVSNGKVGTPQLYDTMLAINSIYSNKKGDIYYFKQNSEYPDSTDFYKNKELVAPFAHISDYSVETGDILISKLKDSEDGSFLEYFGEDKSVEITGNSSYYNKITPKGNIIYSITIESQTYGQDYYYRDMTTGESKKIVEDAHMITPNMKWEDFAG